MVERVAVAADRDLGSQGVQILLDGDPEREVSLPVGAIGAQCLNFCLTGVAYDRPCCLEGGNWVKASGHDGGGIVGVLVGFAVRV